MNINGIINALSYPSQTVKDSFIYTHDRIYNLEVDPQDIGNSNITVGNKVLKYRNFFKDVKIESYVISYGANAALKYLKSKFEGINVEIPVIYFELKGYDIVYSSYICSDGTIPATMIQSKNSTVGIYLSPLSEEDIEVLNVTESIGMDYELCEVENANLAFLGNDKTYYYRCLHGPLIINGSCYSCDSTVGKNRLSKEISQYDIMKLTCKEIFSITDVFNFINDNINDTKFRDYNNKIMKNK